MLRHLTNTSRETTEGGTVFFTGDFGGWKVAVAECGEGNVVAASILERASRRFNPDLALFVGVAGGVKDVMLGDVIVSTKVYGYERGKDTEAGFLSRPVVGQRDHAIEQQARALRQGDKWYERLDTSVSHSKPRLHVGPIAAGERVVASARSATAQLIRQHYSDALGVEMEGYGFLDGVHLNAPLRGSVIRGISDLLDGKTAWRTTAAPRSERRMRPAQWRLSC